MCVCVCVHQVAICFSSKQLSDLNAVLPNLPVDPTNFLLFFSSQILAGCISQIVIVRFYFSQMVIACQLQPSSVAMNLNDAEGIYVDSAW